MRETAEGLRTAPVCWWVLEQGLKGSNSWMPSNCYWFCKATGWLLQLASWSRLLKILERCHSFTKARYPSCFCKVPICQHNRECSQVALRENTPLNSFPSLAQEQAAFCEGWTNLWDQLGTAQNKDTYLRCLYTQNQKKLNQYFQTKIWKAPPTFF